MIHDVQTLVSGNGSWQDKLLAGGDLLLNVAMDASMLIGVGEAVRAVYLGVRLGADVALHAGEEALAHEGEKAVEQGIADSVEHAAQCTGLSFAAATPVSTAIGKQAIGTLHVGQKVLAYNPNTHKMELEPILHVWINHDHDLVDLTLTTLVKGTHGHPATQKSEVLHTNERHPFLTEEKGFLPVSQLRLGMHILRANGNVGVVTREQVVPGAQVMYNLEVAQDHTYTVGDGQWVVHNCGSTGEVLQKLQDAGVKWGENSHFADRFLRRGGSLTADNIKDILVNGDALKDMRTSNFGVTSKIGATRYAVFFDGEGTLMTFLTEDEMSRVAGRYQSTLRSLMPTNFSWLENVRF